MAPPDPHLLSLADDGSPLGAVPLGEPLPEELRLVGHDYVLLAPIGQGGMGEVWRARQLSTRREVALKLLRPGRSEERFSREIAALAKLEHPGITRLLQAGCHEGRPFLVLEFVPGRNLAEEARDGPLPPRSAARAVQEAAEAIAAAHGEGLVHRDLKPSNLIRSVAGRVRITDFGVAKDLHDDSDLTLTGEPMGTPAYMAPEQIDPRRGSIGPRTDVYGLGATLYHLLTGTPPHVGNPGAELLHRVATADPDWSGPWSRLHRDLRIICQRAMHPDPARRYPGAADLAADLARFLDGLPILARPVGHAERALRFLRRPWPLALASALGLVAVLLPVLLATKDRSDVNALLHDWPRTAPRLLHVLDVPDRVGSGGPVAFSDAGHLLALGNSRKAMRLALTDPWTPLPHGPPITNASGPMRFQPATGSLLAADGSGLWRLMMVHPRFQIGMAERAASNVTALAFSTEGQHWAVGSAAGDIEAWTFDQNQFKRVMRARHAGAITSLEFDPPTHRLLAASRDGGLRLWDLRSDEPVHVWDQRNRAVGATFVSRGSRVLAVFAISRRASLLRLLDVASGQERTIRRISAEATRVALSPDATRLAVATTRRDILIFDTLDLLPVAATTQHATPPIHHEFSPDGLRLLSLDATGEARLWDAHTGRPLADPWRGKAGIQHAAFAPDGLRVATGDTAPTSSLWDASCPLPQGWNQSTLVRALLRDGRLEALRRAAWLAPENPDVLSRLAAATAAEPGPTAQPEAAFLGARAARQRDRSPD